VRCLLDTHTFLWFVAGDARLSTPERQSIENPSNTPLLSVASVWEMAIKVSLGKLGLTMPVGDFVREHADRNGIGLLDITLAHVSAVEAMPFHHRDPFDRLLIAQAQVDGLTILGADSAFDAYGVVREW
jgi:PIN domain nuclease of toxin-antitoxin system